MNITSEIGNFATLCNKNATNHFICPIDECTTLQTGLCVKTFMLSSVNYPILIPYQHFQSLVHIENYRQFITSLVVSLRFKMFIVMYSAQTRINIEM